MVISDEEYTVMREREVLNRRALGDMDAVIKRQQETICLLGDTLLAAAHGHSLFEWTPDSRAAAKPLREVIEWAYALMQGYDHQTRTWAAGTAFCADHLRDAMAHPVVAGLIEEWERE